MAGGNIQEAKLIRTGGVIDDRLLHRIAGIAQAHEIDALDDAAILYIQAGNDAYLQHYILPFAMAAMFIKVRPHTASAGTAVVLTSTSASSSRSSASANLSSLQRRAWALKESAREKCTGGLRRFITKSILSPRAALSRTEARRWKCPIALRITVITEVSATQRRSSARSRRAKTPLPAALLFF